MRYFRINADLTTTEYEWEGQRPLESFGPFESEEEAIADVISRRKGDRYVSIFDREGNTVQSKRQLFVASDYGLLRRDRPLSARDQEFLREREVES